MTFATSAETTTARSGAAAAIWTAPEIIDGAPTVFPAVQDGVLLNGIFVEAQAGDLETRVAALGADVERVEIPSDPAARRDFLSKWSGENALVRRGLPIAMLLLPLAACGGGGGGSSNAIGIVQKGYVSGGTVFRDNDRDGVQDAGEPSTTIGTDGRFNLTALGSGSGPLVVNCGTGQCTDTSTGRPFVGTLSAPSNATVITPLTTLVNSLLPTGAAATQAQIEAAVAQVKSSLGMSANATNILTTDLIAMSSAGGTTGSDALAALKTSVQLGNLVASVGGGSNGQALLDQIATAIKPTSQGGQGLNLAAALTDTATITNLIVASNIPNMSVANAQAIAQSVDTMNTQVSNATNATGAENAQPKIFTLSAAASASTSTLGSDYTIADTAANIQAALATSGTNQTRLLGAQKIVAGDGAMTLSIANAALLLDFLNGVQQGGAAKQLLSTYNIVDSYGTGGSAFFNAAAVIFEKAGTVTINGTSGADTIENPLSGLASVANKGVFIDGQAGNDSLFGGAGDDTLRGGTGNDLLDGGQNGTDTADYSYLTGDGASGVRVTLLLDTAVTVTVAAGDVDTLIGIENIIGGSGSDTMVGDAGNNVFSGGGGADTLSGGIGNDTLSGGTGNDVLNGGDGSDTADYSYVTSGGLTVTLNSAGTVALTVAAGSDVDSLINVDNLVGGAGNDTVTGDDGANTLFGSDGMDRLSGGGGADLLAGDAGNDTLTGGAGSDTFLFSTSSALGGADVVTDFTAGVGGDRIDFAFGATGELAQSALRGTGVNYAEVAQGGTIGANVGLVVITTSAELSATQALAFANELVAAGAADQDILFVAFSNGTDAAIFRVNDSDDSGTAFDSAQLLVTLQGVTSAAALDPANFVDFSLPAT
jgi:Ca2+-binding RTX toxin-like protein